MVPLPLFKLASLFVRHISKYGANQIKAQAHDHPRFRAFAATYGQAIHQLNMKLSVALLRDLDAERRAKEKAEAPTAKTEEQQKQADAQQRRSQDSQRKADEQHSHAQEKQSNGGSKSSTNSNSSSSSSSKASRPMSFQSVWRRKFRPLPEAKAVDLFADVIGDTFILTVAGGLIVYEYWKASQKPDTNKERLDDLNRRFDELKKKEDDLIAAEDEQRKRFESLEEVLRALRDPKTKEPLVAALQGT